MSRPLGPMVADPSVSAAVRFRPARLVDATALADLTTQLGYPASPVETVERLAELGDSESVILVAEYRERVVGWVHVRRVVLLTGPHAEIDGLVVDEAYRGRGIGEALLARAEEWAAERGETRIHVRSNVIRERAHGFYERLGYERVKTSYTFAKSISG